MIQGHAQTHDYPRLDELASFRERYDYDPLRFLWTRSVDGQATGEGQSPELATAYSLIAGITDRWELAWWYFAESRTRRRDHVYRRLRQRDIAIVGGDRRFAGTTEYPWERASAVPPGDAALVAGDSATPEASTTVQDGAHEVGEVASDTPSSLGRCPACSLASSSTSMSPVARRSSLTLYQIVRPRAAFSTMLVGFRPRGAPPNRTTRRAAVLGPS